MPELSAATIMQLTVTLVGIGITYGKLTGQISNIGKEVNGIKETTQKQNDSLSSIKIEVTKIATKVGFLRTEISDIKKKVDF